MGVAPLPQTSPIGRSPIVMAVFFPYISILIQLMDEDFFFSNFYNRYFIIAH